MRKIRILCIVIAMFFMTSCGVPFGLVKTEKYVLNEEKLSDIRSCFKAISSNDAYYMEIAANTDEQDFFEQIFVNSDEMVWCMNEHGNEQAYRDGFMYAKKVGSTDAQKTKQNFSTEKYDAYAEQSYNMLKEMLSSDCENFTVMSALSLRSDGDDGIMVTLEFKSDANITKSEYDGIIIEFMYDQTNNTYSDFHIIWNTADTSYYVMFDMDECPENLMSSVEGVIMPTEF